MEQPSFIISAQAVGGDAVGTRGFDLNREPKPVSRRQQIDRPAAGLRAGDAKTTAIEELTNLKFLSAAVGVMR